MTAPVRRRRWPIVVVPLVLALVVAAGGATYALGWVDHWRGTDVPPTPPAPTLHLTPLTVGSVQVAAVNRGGTPNAAAVRRALAGPLASKDFGKRVHAVVAPLSGNPVFIHDPRPATPASTTKLLTTTAALETFGPDHRFATTVTRQGSRLTLVGGGDPLLSSADLAQLARAVASKVGSSGAMTLAYDTSLFTGPSVSPHWPKTYIPEDVVAPISALSVDEGHDPGADGELGTEDDTRTTDPAGDAARAFAAALRKAGVKVVGAPMSGRAQGATIASHSSEPLSRIVEHTLQVSDNEAAEILARQVSHQDGTGGSFTGAVEADVKTLARLGVPTSGIRLYDNSGLSRQDLISPLAITKVLQVAASPDHPELSAVLSGLPVAGFEGSLATRFADDPKATLGDVRAKTGTLTGVHALAGVVTDAKGTPMIVVVMADRVAADGALDAREAIDRAMSAIATCPCS